VVRHRKSYFGVVQWLIASGRDLGDFQNKKGKCPWSDDDYTALEIARDYKRTEVVSLLERFMANPTLTRHDLRVKLGVLEELVAEVFALTVFLCDDHLQLKLASHPAAGIAASIFHYCLQVAQGASDGSLPQDV